MDVSANADRLKNGCAVMLIDVAAKPLFNPSPKGTPKFLIPNS